MINRFAMSNVTPEDTGIEGIGIYISPGECAGKKSRHAPRVKVYRGTKFRQEAILASCTVEAVPRVVRGKLPPRTLKQVAAFITLNLETLLQHWRCEITDKEALVQLKSL